MARNVVKIEGLRELEKALSELPKATGKSVLRRVLKARAQPFDSAWRGMAPDDPATTGEDNLKTSGGVGTKLSKRQAAQHRKMFRSDRASVEMFAGPGALPQAITEEFGTGPRHQKSGKFVGQVHPHPFVRPAWDATKDAMLNGIGKDLGDEIAKAAQRLAKKRARG